MDQLSIRMKPLHTPHVFLSLRTVVLFMNQMRKKDRGFFPNVDKSGTVNQVNTCIEKTAHTFISCDTHTFE